MANKSNGGKEIVKKAQKKFGSLSKPLRDAEHLDEVAVALRALMREQEGRGETGVVNALLRFSKKHQLTGMSQ